jgi:hypothetical protein
MKKTMEQKIKDLKKRIRTKVVKLKQEHIDGASKGSATECPVALAFMETFTGKIHCEEVAVEPAEDSLKATFAGLNGNVRVYCKLPAAAVKLATRWDDDEKVKPMSFRIKKVENIVELK